MSVYFCNKSGRLFKLERHVKARPSLLKNSCSFLLAEHVCVIKIQEPDDELTVTLNLFLFSQFNELYLRSVFGKKKGNTLRVTQLDFYFVIVSDISGGRDRQTCEV